MPALLLLLAPSAWGTNWFVRSTTSCATNGNGTSSSCAASPGGVGAWSGFSNITWGSIHGGDTLFLVAGDTYTGPLTVASSGSLGSVILITVNGSGTATINANNITSGIDLGGQAFVTVDGITGNAALGGSTTYGIKVINVGPNSYTAKIRSGEHDVKVLHVEGTSTVETGTSDEVGGITASNMGAQVSSTQLEVAYNWIHGPTPTSGGSATCNSFSNTKHMWCATGIKLFTTTGGTSFTNTIIHDNLIQNMFNDGIDASGNSSTYHNEVSGVQNSGHSDSLQCQNASYCAIYSNYVHDSNDQNCYLDQTGSSTNAHIRIYNNIFNSPSGFGGCNIDPENGNWDDVVVANNTFFSSGGYHIRIGPRSFSVTNLVILNNIFGLTNQLVSNSFPSVAFDGTATLASSTSWNYDAYSPSQTLFPTLANFSGNKTLAQLQALSPAREANGKTCNVAYLGGALPAGAALGSGDTCAKAVGSNLTGTFSYLTTDFNGNPRPPSGSWDLGAIQSIFAPVLSLSPASPINFGSQNISTTSSPITVTTTNIGTAAEILSTPHFTNSNPTEYPRTGGSCLDAATIPAGSSCTDIFVFIPSAPGTRTANLTINGTVNGSASFTGIGISTAIPVVQLGPRTVNFGTINTGTTSPTTTFTLSNIGTATLGITSITSFDPTHFPISSNLCGATLPAGNSCTFQAAFSPTLATTLNGLITVTTNASSSPDTIAISGTGFTPNPQPPPAPAPVIFIGTSVLQIPQPIVGSVSLSGPCAMNNKCVYMASCSQCSSSTILFIDGQQVPQTYANGVMTYSSKLTAGTHSLSAVNLR